MNSQRFLFISTPFRSGSALLSRNLNAHSQISLLNDSLKYFNFCYNRYLPLTESNISRMLNNVEQRLLKRFDINIEVQTCLDKIKQQPVSQASIYAILLQHLFRNQNKRFIGEMESISWSRIPLFLNMFPNSKALLIVRDLRDVVVSFKKKTIAPDNDYLVAIFNVIDAMDHFIECKNNFPDRFHGIRFEELKKDPEKVMKRSCEFLGLDYEPEMINEDNWTDYHGEKWKNRKVSSFYNEGDHHSPVERWRRLITPEELFLCEWIGRRQMLALNMRIEGQPVSQKIFNNAIKMITSSNLLKESFKKWCETGKGIQRYPLDPTDPSTWDKNPKTS